MALKDLFTRKPGKTLYYAGPLTREYYPKEFDRNLEVFKKLKIQVTTLDTEYPTGLEFFHDGYPKEAKVVAEKNQEVFKKLGIKKIITSCPESFHTFKSKYPKWLKGWDIEVEHSTQAILAAIKKQKINIHKEDKEIVTYHDPCYLGRWENEYDASREVIKILGAELIEAVKSRENAICCGGSGNVMKQYPQEAQDMAKQRLSHFPDDAKKIITPEGTCFALLSQQNEKVITFSEFVLQKLRSLSV